ncbi:ergothioneine biosynthesis protein EgtB [Inmirania thermothiophila]|uniref:Ergothioneine biosynthesis protein EgtB n=1 Tax=Inmirania thermothiophila TaxID=1750597 RepID=A0A3N1XZI4_9GAMM|nr:ergothioneine biosynthesis protein EgtB [Inmirania thermothiophila]ROR31990.1 ergothioneine biosynthesis protein EgtB [Inmirania thermothiophila]
MSREGDWTTALAAPPAGEARGTLIAAYRAVRGFSERICRPLEIEDHVVQSIPEVSPPKWHLAHVTWFFETFVLAPLAPDHRPFRPAYAQLFNSYYETVGSFWPRPRRGLLSRPTVAEILRYRAHVDAAMTALLAQAPAAAWPEIAFRTVLGLHHEQQHQELLLTDIKHNLGIHPLRPAYRDDLAPPPAVAPASMDWIDHPGGLVEIGHGGAGFAYDNETPRHRVWLAPFRIASRPVTCGEYLAFVEDGGYRDPRWWLADAWVRVRDEGWRHPLHWHRGPEGWEVYTLGGVRPLAADEPVAHLSFYEADAYARWAGARLPTEAEWEVVARETAPEGNFVEDDHLHPVPVAEGAGVRGIWGQVWEWTASPYRPYPGFRPLAGSLGEYNAKFMANQMVCRGGSCLTSRTHVRATYRNFFYGHDRWQMTGMRLAADP